MTLPWQARARIWLTGLLIKTGKLPFDAFTRDELNALLRPRFPINFDFTIPAGRGRVCLTEGQIILDENNNRLATQCLAELTLTALDTRIYRAHIILIISASPHYQPENATVYLENSQVDVIQFVNDNFAFVEDTRQLIAQLLPGAQLGRSLTSLLTEPLANIASIASMGKTDRLTDYLKLFIAGDKQKIVNYHKPQIESALLGYINTHSLAYTMGDSWREQVFKRWGKTVRVEQDKLLFCF